MNDVRNEAAILVGVGPDGHLSEGTVSFAVSTAQHLGVGIELLHVVPTLIGGPTGTWDVGITIDQLVTSGRERLDQAVQQVRERMGGVQPVSGELARGGVIKTLIELSSVALMIVLEHRQLGRWDRLSTGSVTAGVAARAHAPVVSVPASWRPDDAPRPITVAVEDAKRAAAELWTALGLAAAIDVPVVALRVTYLSPAHEQMLIHEGNHDDLLLAARQDLVRDAELPASVCERVPCSFVVRWGRPAEVLVDASYGSSMLVLARRDPLMPFGSHLGPVVRQVLRLAACPVMVVEPSLPRPIVVSTTPFATPTTTPVTAVPR